MTSSNKVNMNTWAPSRIKPTKYVEDSRFVVRLDSTTNISKFSKMPWIGSKIRPLFLNRRKTRSVPKKTQKSPMKIMTRQKTNTLSTVG